MRIAVADVHHPASGQRLPCSQPTDPGLSRSEERALILRAHRGERAAVALLVQANLASLGRLASKLRWWGVPVDDLVHEGVIAMLESLPSYEDRSGVRLLTFCAHSVRTRMFKAIVEVRGMGMARRGSAWGRSFFRLRRELDRARRDDADVVAAAAVAMGATRDTALASIALDGRLVSLDASAQTGSAWMRCGRANPEQVLLRREADAARRAAIRRALAVLSDRERWIVERRMMSEPPPTYRGMGRHLGISGERVKQIEDNAMRRMRGALLRHGVRAA